MSCNSSRSPPCAGRRLAGRLWLGMVIVAALVAAPQGAGVIAGVNGDIAFDSRRGGETDLYVVSPAGGAERRLDGNAAGAIDARPSWAPPPNVSNADFALDHTTAPVGTEVEILGLSAYTATTVWIGTSRATVTSNRFTVPAGAQTGPVCVEVASTLPLVPISSRVRWFAQLIVPGTEPTTASIYCPSQPIVFQSDRTGDFDLWALDPASTDGSGSAVPVLTLAGSDETAPAWSSGPGNTLGHPDPSPVIAFESNRAGSRDIWLLDPARPVDIGTNPSQLTSGTADDANPDWAPGGGSIAFESDRDGQKDIWVIDVSAQPSGGWTASNLRKVTVDQPPSYEPSWFHYALTAPTFEQIAFSGPAGDASCELNYVEQLRRDGNGLDVNPPAFAVPAGIEAWTFPGTLKDDSPAYSPYGDRIAFHSTAAGNDDIWTVQVASSQESSDPVEIGTRVQLTTNAAPDRNPSWRPGYLMAQVSFRRPWGRARRRPRPLAAARTIALVPTGGCSETPRAALAVTPSPSRPGEPVTLDASASLDPDGSIVGFEWDLDGDGVYERTGVEAVVQHTYATPGTYTVAVRVTDHDGLQARRAETVEVAVPTHELAVTKTGNGIGTVSSPAGLDCGSACTGTFDESTVVTLTATPSPPSRFAGWTGCDSALGAACTVTMTGSRSVTARFTTDTAAPNTRIRSGPGRARKGRRATFRFVSTEAGSRFQCRLDRRRWAACRSPKSYTVTRGRHTFAVRAIDASGNVDSTPATKRWRRK